MNELLKNFYLFRELDTGHLEEIDGIARLRSYETGETIFRQGSEAESLYIIQRGTVEIAQEMADGKHIEISTLATGSHFGEMALLDKRRRSAAATARSRSDIVEIGYEDLEALLEKKPALAAHVYRELARFLCSRLRLTTLDLSYERSRNISLF